MKIDVFTLFPQWFDWFRDQRHVKNALALGHQLEAIDLRATTPLTAGQVDDTPYGGGAGMVIRVDVVEEALRARYGGDPLDLPARRSRARLNTRTTLVQPTGTGISSRTCSCRATTARSASGASSRAAGACDPPDPAGTGRFLRLRYH